MLSTSEPQQDTQKRFAPFVVPVGQVNDVPRVYGAVRCAGRHDSGAAGGLTCGRLATLNLCPA